MKDRLALTRYGFIRRFLGRTLVTASLTAAATPAVFIAQSSSEDPIQLVVSPPEGGWEQFVLPQADLSVVYPQSAAGLTACPPPIIRAATLGSDSPDYPSVHGTQTGRILRDDPESTCAVPQTCSIFDSAFRAYDAYVFRNVSSAAACARVDITTPCTGTNFLQVAAYRDFFSPGAPCGNHLADMGGSPNPDKSMSFLVPAGSYFVVVVHEVGAGAGCAMNYTLSVSGLNCPVSWDYDGQGTSDKTLFRSGSWFTLTQAGVSLPTVSWGMAGDVPVPGNYGRDGRTDYAVYRSGTYHIQTREGTILSSVPWGIAGDVPVPGNFGGDGRHDYVVFRPSNGTWNFRTNEGTLLPTVSWGTSGDIPVSGDFDGDGLTDVAVWRPSSGTWFLRKSAGGFTTFPWGTSGDLPVPADFDGDGRADFCVFRPSTGTWFRVSSATFTALPLVVWGVSGDVPLPSNMVGDERADFVVWRGSTGAWHVRSAEGVGQPTVNFGTSGDVPLAK